MSHRETQGLLADVEQLAKTPHPLRTFRRSFVFDIESTKRDLAALQAQGIHGDDDQIVPIGASAMLSSKLVPNATLKIYSGGSHSLGDTSKEQLNADLLAFIQG